MDGAPSPMRLVAATRNRGKAEEFGRLLGEWFALEPLPPGAPLPEETGSTFVENATLKARAVFATLGDDTAAVADDSGLIAQALGDRPGVRSARYAGPSADDGQNVARLLADLQGVDDRRARFVCALALVLPGGELVTVEGCLRGTITTEPRGRLGFGYDPVFVPEGWTHTLAEVPGATKDTVSHRARAVAQLLECLRERGGVR